MPIHLTNVDIKNFRSIYGTRPLEIDLGDGVNTIVGPNNSGKSNILRAIALAFADDEDASFHQDRDVPQQLTWARPSVTLQFTVINPSNVEKTLLRYANDYEKSVIGSKNTAASKGVIRLRVKYQNSVRQEFLAAAGAGDRRGDDSKNRKAIDQLRKCVRFVYVQSGEDIKQFLSGRFNDVLRSVMKEADRAKFDEVMSAREKYMSALRKDLLTGLTTELNLRIKHSFRDIGSVELTPLVPSLEESVAATSVAMSDGARTDLQGKGTGIRGGLLISMLRYLAEHSKRSLVFAIEEPESFLHPGAQKDVSRELEGVVEWQGTSLIVSSHSPFILSRRDDAKAFSVAKTDAGATYVANECEGPESHARVISPLFNDLVVPRIIEAAAQIPEGTKGVLIVEGYTDRLYIELAAEKHGLTMLLDGILIHYSNGAMQAAMEAIIWRSRDVAPVRVLLDSDVHGKEARKLLTGKFGFSGKHVFQYSKWIDPNFPAEAEDLFPEELLRKFVVRHGEQKVLAEKRKYQSKWHYGFTQEGKEHFAEYLRIHSKKGDFTLFSTLVRDLADAYPT